jgi:hypothetical protein
VQSTLDDYDIEDKAISRNKFSQLFNYVAAMAAGLLGVELLKRSFRRRWPRR